MKQYFKFLQLIFSCGLFFYNTVLYSSSFKEDISLDSVLNKLQALKREPREGQDSQIDELYADIKQLQFRQKIQVVMVTDTSKLEKVNMTEDGMEFNAKDWHYRTLLKLQELDEKINDRSSSEGVTDASKGSINLATFRISVRYQDGHEAQEDFSSHIFLSRGTKKNIEASTMNLMEEKGYIIKTMEDVADTRDEKDYKKQLISLFNLETKLSIEERSKIIKDILSNTGLVKDEQELTQLVRKLAQDPLALTEVSGFDNGSNLIMKALLTRAAWALFPDSKSSYYQGKGKNLSIESPISGLATLMSTPAMLIHSNANEDFFKAGIGKSLSIPFENRGLEGWIGKTADILFGAGETFVREFYHSEQVIRLFIHHIARVDFGLSASLEEKIDRLRTLDPSNISSLKEALEEESQISLFKNNLWDSLLSPEGQSVDSLQKIQIDIATHRLICPVCASTYFYDANHAQQINKSISHAIKKAEMSKEIEEKLRNEYSDLLKNSMISPLEIKEEQEFTRMVENLEQVNEFIKLRKRALERGMIEKAALQRDSAQLTHMGAAKGKKPKGYDNLQKRINERANLLTSIDSMLNHPVVSQQDYDSLKDKMNDILPKLDKIKKDETLPHKPLEFFISSCRE